LPRLPSYARDPDALLAFAMTPAATPAVTVVQFAVDLLVGAVIFVLAVVVTALVLRLVQIVLPGPDTGAEAARQLESEAAAVDDSVGGDLPGAGAAAETGAVEPGAGTIGAKSDAGGPGGGRVGPGAWPGGEGSSSPHAMGRGTEGSDQDSGRRA
jgi:hypothetical protein